MSEEFSGSHSIPSEAQDTHSDADYAVFEHLHFPACILGKDGKMIFGNRAFNNLFKNEDGQTHLNWDHPLSSKYRKRMAQAYLKAMGGIENKCFAIINSSDGQELPVEIYLSPLYTEKAVSSILVLMHIADRSLMTFDKSTLSLISEDNFQYDTQHLQFSPLPILRFNRNMEIIKISASIEGFLGYSREEFIEKHSVGLKDIFLYDADRVKNAIAEIFTGERPFHRKGEIKVGTKNSESKITNLTIYPVVMNNEISTVELVFEDITEVKSLKDKINSINRIQLLHDITKGFLHSLNNSINIIMSQTQLLLQITEKRTVIDGIHTIEQSALKIVDNIRRVQNSIAKKNYFDEERTESLVNIIEDTIEFARMRFKVDDKEKRRDIAIEKKYFSSVSITIDTGLLREIIISIILKVATYIDKKGTIEILLKENNDVTLSFKVVKALSADDTVELHNLVNVFSGIDIRQAAEKINLKIIEEESAENYSIKIVFPQRLISSSRPDESEEKNVKLRDLDIIIVEDEIALKKILFEIFDRMGNRVFICDNGLDALEEFKKKHYDLVISDYGIPGITGLELAVRVKEIQEQVKTVLLSGWTLEDLTVYHNVIDLFMPKPFKLDDLIKNISHLLNASKKS